MPPTFTRRRARAILCALRRMSPEERARVLCRMPEPVLRAIEEEWWWQAHGGQIEPKACDAGSGPWRVRLIMAGRGFGKTRAGAEWVWARVREWGREGELGTVTSNEGELGTVTSNCPRPLRRGFGKTRAGAEWVWARVREWG
ncbi:MAG: hypothetical protein QOI38_216, partial [Sphingomonadales bacterium]|nr:hypothetical protein [Sphingomonadales bacterium]